MNDRHRTVLKLAVSFVLLGVLFSQVDWHRSVALIRGADPRWLAVVLFIQVSDRVLMALKWHQLLRLLDPGLSRLNAIRVYYESGFVGFALPLGGLGPDIVRFFRLREYGIAPHVGLASIVMERVIGLIATLVMVAVAFSVFARLTEQPALRYFAVMGALAAAGGAVATAAVLFHHGAKRVAARFVTWTGLTVRNRLDRYIAAARAYADRPLVLFGNLWLSLLEQLIVVLPYWAGSRALGVPLPLVVCLAVAPLTSVIHRLPISYAGLGLREGGTAAALVALGYNYSDALILSMTLFVVYLVALLPGAAVLLARGRPQIDSTEERRTG